jgi:hypothetical protein
MASEPSRIGGQEELRVVCRDVLRDLVHCHALQCVCVRVSPACQDFEVYSHDDELAARARVLRGKCVFECA